MVSLCKKYFTSLILILCFFKGLRVESCQSQIYDSYGKIDMTNPKFTTLCNLLLNKSNTLFIRITDDVSHQGEHYDVYFNQDNDQMFTRICKYCSSSILLSVYFNPKKIRLTVGSEVDKRMNNSFKNSIMDVMKPHLKANDYNTAFILAINKINEKVPNSYVVEHVQETHSRGGFSGLSIFIMLMICICCIGCIVCYIKKSQEEITDVQHVPLVESQDEYQPILIHNHMEKLLNIVKFRIRPVSPPIIQIDECTLCCELLNPNWEADYRNNNTNSYFLIRKFTCGHHYHSNCLTKFNVNSCFMCEGNFIFTNVDPSYRYFNIVNEDNIFCLLKRFDELYPKPSLIKYRERYTNDVHYVREVYPSYPTTFIWIETGGYHNNNYGYYNQGYNNYDPPSVNPNQNYYTSTTGADYGNQVSSNTYEMQNVTSQANYDDDNRGDY